MSATATPNGIRPGDQVAYNDGIVRGTFRVTGLTWDGKLILDGLDFSVHYSTVTKVTEAAPASREIQCYDKVVYQGQTRTVVQICDGSDGIRRAMLSGGGYAIPVSELHRPGEEPAAPAPAPTMVVLPARAPLAPPAPKVRRPRRTLTPVTRRYATALLVGQPGVAHRRECFSAVSTDGVWSYHREDEPTTPWYVKHLPTGVELGPWGTLNDAREDTANGTALAQVESRLAEQGAEVVAEAEQVTRYAAPTMDAIVAEAAPHATVLATLLAGRAPLTTTTPVARGRLTAMSASQAAAILLARAGGAILRGKPAVDGIPTGCLDVKQLRAAAERGWLTLTTEQVGRRTVVTGGIVTEQGAKRAAQITNA